MKVSIIIPIYNAEEHFAKCIDSILLQSYKDIEIIMLNDGSTDTSQKMIDEYCKKYPDICKGFSHKNMGVAKTRNRGIELASGDYIMFADNDDFIDKDYIQAHIDACKNGYYDVVISGYKRTNTRDEVINQVKLDPDAYWSRFMIIAPWAKLYRHSYLIDNQFKFLDSNIGEDIFFNIQALTLSEKIKTLDYCGYNWFYNEESISNTVHKHNDKSVDFMFLLDTTYARIKTLDLNKNKYIEYFFIKTIIWFLFYSCKGSSIEGTIDNKNIYFKWLDKSFPEYKKNPYIKPGKPVGEIKKYSMIVYSFIKMNNLGLSSAALKLYKKL